CPVATPPTSVPVRRLPELSGCVVVDLSRRQLTALGAVLRRSAWYVRGLAAGTVTSGVGSDRGVLTVPSFTATRYETRDPTGSPLSANRIVGFDQGHDSARTFAIGFATPLR